MGWRLQSDFFDFFYLTSLRNRGCLAGSCVPCSLQSESESGFISVSFLFTNVQDNIPLCHGGSEKCLYSSQS